MKSRIRHAAGEEINGRVLLEIVGRRKRACLWKVRCRCNRIFLRTATDLLRSNGCKACQLPRLKPRTEQQLRYIMWKSAKARAKRKGLSFTIDLEHIIIPAYCPLLDIPIFVGEGKACDNSPSLDQVYPGKGYTPKNVWVISYRANTLKSNATFKELNTLLLNWEHRARRDNNEPCW
jgi:hypothetical protein